MPRSVLPPLGKYMAGWRKPFGAGPAAHEMRRRGGAADEEHPHIFAHRARSIPVAPANVVQRGFHRLPRGPLHAIREQRIEPRAFIHFVEVHQRLALRTEFAGRRGCAPADDPHC